MTRSKVTLYVNGRIITMNEEHPLADAMAIEGAYIQSVGDTPTLQNSHSDADVVDLEGNTVMPGIIESHGHLLNLGKSLMELNLAGLKTPEDVLRKVKPRELLSIKVLQTYVGGRLVYDSEREKD